MDTVSRLLPKPNGLSGTMFAAGRGGGLDRASVTTETRRFLISRGFAVARGASTVCVEKHANVSRGDTVTRRPGDVVLPESDYTYRMLFQYALTLTADSVKDMRPDVQNSDIGSTKRGRTAPPQPGILTESAKH